MVEVHAAGVNLLDSRLRDGARIGTFAIQLAGHLGACVATTTTQVNVAWVESLGVLDRVFPFESTNEAMAYVETGRAKGKVVVKLK
jgi:NADPH:quinone reductase-like Zn-dependent oxidoreductase